MADENRFMRGLFVALPLSILVWTAALVPAVTLINIG